MRRGSLTVVGTGIRHIGQVTLETQGAIQRADRVFHVVTGEPIASWILELNPRAESLVPLYREGRSRWKTYAQMVRRMLAAVRRGQKVCAVFYGHPGVFAFPSHETIRRARAEGYAARMLPGISAEDCLFADLGVDPATKGCQSFETTDFLLRRRAWEPTSVLILWQVGVIGDLTFRRGGIYRRGGLPVLVDVLREKYPADYEVVLYEAPELPLCEPVIRRVPLNRLSRARVTAISTLYVAPLEDKTVDPEMMARLGLSKERLRRAFGRGPRR